MNSLEIEVDTKELVHVLSAATSIVEKRNVIAELANVKISTLEGTLEVAATDMDLYLSQTISAQVFAKGVTTVSSKLLTDIVKKIPDKEVKLKHNPDTEQLEIRGQKCFFSLPTLAPEQFPVMDYITAECELRVPCTSLVKLIEYTQFAMSSEEARYNLNGVYLHVKPKELCAAATDGHRLSTVKVEADVDNEYGVIIPRKTSQEILKILKDTRYVGFDVNILLANNKIKFVCQNVMLVSKLIDGQFPEYSALIPKDNDLKLTINPMLLSSVIDRVATVTMDKFRAVKMIITSECVEINATGEARGTAKEQILYADNQQDYCSFSGNRDVTIGFNPKYLTDILNIIKSELVEIYFNNSDSPTLIKSSSNPDDNFVVMPVKV